MTNLDSILKSRAITLLTKVHPVKAMASVSSHVWMQELDHKESWTLKNWCFSIVVLEKTLKSLFHFKEIKPINPKGNQSWIVLGRNDAEAEAPVFGPPDQRTDSFEKILTLGKIKAGGEGDKRGWDGWMASPTQWTWFWASSGSWWWTGNPGVLQSMGLQRVGHHWATELTDWPSTSTLVRMFFSFFFFFRMFFSKRMIIN